MIAIITAYIILFVIASIIFIFIYGLAYMLTSLLSYFVLNYLGIFPFKIFKYKMKDDNDYLGFAGSMGAVIGEILCIYFVFFIANGVDASLEDLNELQSSIYLFFFLLFPLILFSFLTIFFIIKNKFFKNKIK